MALFSSASPSSGAPNDDVAALLAQLGIGAGAQGQSAPAASTNAQQVSADLSAYPDTSSLGLGAAPQAATASGPPQSPSAPSSDGGPLGALLSRVQNAFGGGPPPQSQDAPGLPSGFPAPPPARSGIGPLEAIGDFALGGLPTAIKNANYDRQVQAYQRQAQIAQLQRAYGVIQSAADAGQLSGPDLAAAQADPVGFLQNLEEGQKARLTTPLKPGDTLANGGNGSPFYAPNYGISDGTPYAQQGPVTTTSQRLPGKASVDASGNITDGNTGAVLGSVPTFQHFAPGENHGFVQPGVQAPSAPSAGGSPPAPAGSGPNGAPANIGEALRMRWTAQGVPAGDQAALLATGKIESNFDPNATNGASRGLYQFQPSTFRAVGGTNIDDPGQQADAAAQLWSANRQSLTGALGRAPTDAELYLAHQQGAGGAGALLKAPPSQNAIQALVQAGVYANPAIARRAITNNGGSRTTTAGQFVQQWQDKFGQAMRATGNAQVAPGGPAQAGAQQSNAGALGSESLSGGVAKRLLTPDEVSQAGFPTGAVVERAPDGSLSVVQAPQWNPEREQAMNSATEGNEQFKQAQESAAAYQSMIDLAKQPPGGMRAYALRDTFARTINPGAVARAGTIEAIKQSQGLPANLQAYLMNMKGNGDVPPQIVQQIVDAARPFAEAHWQQANAMNEHNRSIASGYGGNPDHVTEPLAARPAPYVTAAPPLNSRVQGQVYETPKGRLMWTRAGWLPAR